MGKEKKTEGGSISLRWRRIPGEMRDVIVVE